MAGYPGYALYSGQSNPGENPREPGELEELGELGKLGQLGQLGQPEVLEKSRVLDVSLESIDPPSIENTVKNRIMRVDPYALQFLRNDTLEQTKHKSEQDIAEQVIAEETIAEETSVYESSFLLPIYYRGIQNLDHTLKSRAALAFKQGPGLFK